MKKRIWLIYVILILFSDVCSAEKINNTINAKNQEDYFPIAAGSYWKYDTNNGEMSVKIVKEEGENRVISVSEISAAVSKEYFYSTGSEIMSSRRETNVFFLGDSYKYVPHFPRVKYPLVKGQEWLWKGKKLRGGDNFKNASIEMKVLGREEVSVTAGNFDCVKIQMNGSDEDGSKENFYQWLAPGIGMVKGEGLIVGTGVLGALSNLFGGGKIILELKEYIITNEDTAQ